MKYLAMYEAECRVGDTIEEALTTLSEEYGVEMEDCEVFEIGKQIEFEVKQVIVTKPVITAIKKVSK